MHLLAAPHARGLRLPAAALALALLLVVLGFAGTARAAYVGATDSVTPATIATGGTTEYAVDFTGTTVSSVTPTDVMLVLDESGSIGSADFARMKQFALNTVSGLANAGLFTNGGRVGVVMFSGSARPIIAPSTNPQMVLNAINSISQRGGNTCIGCGVQLAHQMLVTAGATGRKQVSVVLTDGFNNVNTTTFPSVVANAKAAGIEHFAIGVGSDPRESELNLVASEPDATHVFTVSDFASLGAILSALVAAVVEPAETGIVWELEVDDAFVPSAETADKGTVTRTGNTIRWEIPALAAETARLTFTATHDADAGCGTIDVVESTTYDSDQNSAAPAISGGPVDVTGCDETAPAITITTPADGATYAYGQALEADYACADEAGGSGVATCAGTLADGAAIDTMTPGTGSFSVTATDVAGNSATETAAYTVQVTAASLCAVTTRMVEQGDRWQGMPEHRRQPAESLTKGGCDKLDNGKVDQYRASLHPLVVQGWLTQEEADALTAAAGEL